MRFGIKTRPEHTTWAEIRDVAVAADEIDLFESWWNWDLLWPNRCMRYGPPAQPLPAGIYGRVSEDGSGRAWSVAEQFEANRPECDEHGWHVAAAYEDADTPASRYARKVRANWARLLEDVEGGRIRVLVLWESSRGSRRVGEWVNLIELCEDHGVRIHVTTHGRPYDPGNARDRRSLIDDANDAEFESAKTSERVKRSLRKNKAKGMGHGRCPFGWRYVYDSRTGELVGAEKIPEQAAVRAEIVERVARGELFVHTDSVAWGTQVRLLAPGLIKRINAELGAGTIRRIRVRNTKRRSA